MHIVVVGVNHRSAPVEVRERLAFRQEDLPRAFSALREQAGLEEAAILSTCNRVEIYAGVPELDGAKDRLQRFLSEYSGLGADHLGQQLYHLTEPGSIRHLFSVASGLDSMVLGEAEILSQVKHAYEWAKGSGATGKVFNVLFQRALNTAKAVRTQTGISRGATSIGSVAIELAGKIFGDLSKATVLLVGAGKVGELTLGRLKDRGVREARIINRSIERAARLAADYQASAMGFDALPRQLVDADIVITSTSAPGYIMTRSDIAEAMRMRHQRPLCLVDLGVPRNIEPSAGGFDNVYVFNIDDLQGLVEHSHQERAQAITASQAIIDRKVELFLSWRREEAAPCVPS